MKTLLNQTTTADAIEIFETTYTYKYIAQKLDDATIHFTNVASQLKTSDPKIITQYINDHPNDYFLDVLAICYLIENPVKCHYIEVDIINHLTLLKSNIIRAKKQLENCTKYCDENLYDSSRYILNNLEMQYSKANIQLTCIRAIINLIKHL